jgi:hypothetical protein
MEQQAEEKKSYCRSCNAEIKWLKTRNAKNIPVDIASYNGEVLFDRTKHRAHFETCPNASQHRRT